LGIGADGFGPVHGLVDAELPLDEGGRIVERSTAEGVSAFRTGSQPKPDRCLIPKAAA
jgi:hypothetical protein